MIDPIELEKSLDVKIQVMEKGTDIDPINITTQKYANPEEITISSDVEVKTMENSSVLTNSMTSKAAQLYEEDIIVNTKSESWRPKKYDKKRSGYKDTLLAW